MAGGRTWIAAMRSRTGRKQHATQLLLSFRGKAWSGKYVEYLASCPGVKEQSLTSYLQQVTEGPQIPSPLLCRTYTDDHCQTFSGTGDLYDAVPPTTNNIDDLVAFACFGPAFQGNSTRKLGLPNLPFSDQLLNRGIVVNNTISAINRLMAAANAAHSSVISNIPASVSTAVGSSVSSATIISSVGMNTIYSTAGTAISSDVMTSFMTASMASGPWLPRMLAVIEVLQHCLCDGLNWLTIILVVYHVRSGKW